MQAKLAVIGTEDNNSNGQGVVESSVVLYDVCEPIRCDQTKRKEKDAR